MSVAPAAAQTPQAAPQRSPTHTRAPRPFAQARGHAALAKANLRYWTNVAPTAREQLRRWRVQARLIEDREDRALALQKLDDEHFNARAGAILATQAPRAARAAAVRAIVAGQVLFDYLDGLTEREYANPLAEGERLFEAYTEAANPEEPAKSPPPDNYLWRLSHTAREAFASLPAARAVGERARACAREAGEAQTRMHAVASLGTEQLQTWAKGRDDRLGWRETLAGKASSVVVVHALVVAAADPSATAARARALADAYLAVCGVLTLLDSVVDREHDGQTNTLGFVDLYDSRDELASAMAALTREARRRTEGLPNAAHHTAMLAGVAAFFGTTAGARNDWARPVLQVVQDELRPGVGDALAVMRLWRLARRGS